MRIAITGASGFIGCHVVRELAARGIEITVARFGRPNPRPPSLPGSPAGHSFACRRSVC
ncbi:MAG: NAD(P)-dependent oxidoreductase [Thermomonas sp.]|nr:NAD(P)-dependent oxidoreductase [Thermomonas sp.]